MVDQTVNRHSSMDVTLESQNQLVSRIGLAIKSSNKLSFLHGETGVGKSHVASLLQSNLPNIHVVKLQLKNTLEPEQLKQHIICELATDELSDLNQPISAAVYDNIRHKNLSTLLVIDNAELIPQQTLSGLWQSIHEFNRMNQTHLTFNILLVASSRWALPMYSGLKNKTDSLVAEFALASLTKQQATDFMMNVHADWSDIKIHQFINKIAPDYLTPKQLIYAKIPSVNRHQKKILLSIGLIVILLISVAIVGSFSVDKTPITTDIPQLVSNVSTPLVSKPKINEYDVKDVEYDIPDIEPAGPEEVKFVDKVIEKNKPPSLVIAQQSEETNTVLLSTDILDVDNKNEITVIDNSENEIVNTKQLAVTKEQIDSVEELKTPISTTIVNHYKFDEEFLLNVPINHYALMLGGYSNEETLKTMQATFTEQSMIYQYETIRDKQAWFVLLYGVFDTIDQANKFIAENSIVFNDFSPWVKPIRSIQLEIEVSQ